MPMRMQLQSLIQRYTFGANRPNMILIHAADLQALRYEEKFPDAGPGIEAIQCMGVPLIESDLVQVGYPQAVVR